MNRITVASSAIRSVGYDATSRTLEIEFHKGAVYQYRPVPEEVHRRLMSAPSKGAFFRDHIQPHYSAHKIL